MMFDMLIGGIIGYMFGAGSKHSKAPPRLSSVAIGQWQLARHQELTTGIKPTPNETLREYIERTGGDTAAAENWLEYLAERDEINLHLTQGVH